MAESFAAPSIVVGIDGSRAGVGAALWAIDEALGRDLPLRLVAAAEPGDTGGADHILNAAAAAVGQTGRAVTVYTEVIAGPATQALIEASRGAAMLCVGAVGLKHFDRARVGSTAAALVAAAHCPVAVVRGTDEPAPTSGWVVVQLDQSPDDAAVLAYAVEEARMRGAPLRALGTWQSGARDTAGQAQAGLVVHAHLDRRLEQWRHRYPDLDVLPVAVRGSGLSYLKEHCARIQLVVVGARDAAELLGPSGLAALQDTDCSILVVDRQRLL